MLKLIRRLVRGPIIEQTTGAHGTFRRYRNGQITFTQFKDGKEIETDVPADIRDLRREWRAMSLGGAGKFSTPPLSYDEAAQYVADRGGPIVYQDIGAGLIFYRPKG